MQLRINFTQFSTGFLVPLLILAIVVSAFVFVRPKYKAVKSQKTALAIRESVVATKERQLSSIKDLTSDLQRKRTDLEPVDEALPSSPAVPEILSGLESLATQSGLLISSLHLTIAPKIGGAATAEAVPSSKLQSISNLVVLELALNLKGKYINLKTFLKNLEQNRRIMDVSSLTLSSAEQDGSQTYTLKVHTYYQKE